MLCVVEWKEEKSRVVGLVAGSSPAPRRGKGGGRDIGKCLLAVVVRPGRGQAAFVLLRAQKPCHCSIFLRHPFPRARVLSPPTRKKDLFFLRRRIFSRIGFPGNPVVEEMRSPPPPGRGGVTKRMDALHGCGGKKRSRNKFLAIGGARKPITSPTFFLLPPSRHAREK